ncbi:MAG: hypothetical protein WBE44_13385 [Terriglobales bacterium]
MSSPSDTEYSEPFRQVDATWAANFQRPTLKPLDRLERALNGSLCETELSEDEWDRFAAMRDQSYRNKRDWQLSVTGTGFKCVSAAAARRLAAILDDLSPVPYLTIHTMQGLARARRKFKDRVTREVHFFLGRHDSGSSSHWRAHRGVDRSASGSFFPDKPPCAGGGVYRNSREGSARSH